MPRLNRLNRLVILFGLAALLQACQLSLPGGGRGANDVTANAVAGGEIEVTALDASPATATSATSAVAPQGAAPQDTASGAAEAPAEPAPEPVPVPEPEPEPLPEPELADTAPDVQKSEAQLACEKKRGRWVVVGSGALRACIFNTKDSGKQCSRESQCEGACLARSGTCAPFRPLLGCHEVLQNNGALAKQCIE